LLLLVFSFFLARDEKKYFMTQQREKIARAPRLFRTT
jgi:hypothetical protein